jgi:TetR/AcrR family transcriptional regulator, repressor for uid operon
MSDQPTESPDPLVSECTRAETRRTQILRAAEDCFRCKGFHGASIALISKAAGMSPGHIYHYFENKEAIIAAIVARDVERMLTLTAEIRSASNVREAMLERVTEGVEECLDARGAGLKLEIVAEGARNPHIAEVIRAADRTCRESLALTLRDTRRASGYDDDDATIGGMVEVLCAMFEGLMIRRIRNPDLDPAPVVRLFQGALRDLLNHED